MDTENRCRREEGSSLSLALGGPGTHSCLCRGVRSHVQVSCAVGSSDELFSSFALSGLSIFYIVSFVQCLPPKSVW